MGNQKEGLFIVKDSVRYAWAHFILVLRRPRILDLLKKTKRSLGSTAKAVNTNPIEEEPRYFSPDKDIPRAVTKLRPHIDIYNNTIFCYAMGRRVFPFCAFSLSVSYYSENYKAN
jgi:hypothetical protein